MPNKPVVPAQPGQAYPTPYPMPDPQTGECPTPRPGEPCPEEPDCTGYFSGGLHGHIALHCKCSCPVYKDVFVMLTPTTPQANVYADITAWLAANPGAMFGSITDLEHAGWLLHVRVPV